MNHHESTKGRPDMIREMRTPRRRVCPVLLQWLLQGAMEASGWRTFLFVENTGF